MSLSKRPFALLLMTIAGHVKGEYQRASCTRHSYCQAPFPTLASYRPPPQRYALQHVVLIARHGDRTSLTTQEHGGVSSTEGGQLTAKGHHQLRNLGAHLRSIYSLEENCGSVTAEATPYARTVASAEALLEGLFSSAGSSIPIGILNVSHPLHERAAAGCPRLAQILHFTDNLFSIPVAELFRRADDQFVIACSDDPPSQVDDVSDDRDYCEPARSAFYILRQELRPLARVHSGPLMMQLVEQIQKTTGSAGTHGRPVVPEGADGRSVVPARTEGRPVVHVLVVHDTTLADLMMAMDVEINAWPPYAANLLLELWRDEEAVDVHRVRILYNGEVQPMGWCDTNEDPHFPHACSWTHFLQHHTPTMATAEDAFGSICSI